MCVPASLSSSSTKERMRQEAPPPSMPVDAEAERRLVRKQDVRIIPLSAAAYLL